MVNYNSTLALFHVLGAECSVPSLKIKDILEIKTSNNLPFSYRILLMFKIFHSNINLIPPEYKQYFNTFDNMIKYISYYELENLAYAYILSTYDINENNIEKNITCPSCEFRFKKDIALHDYIDIESFKIWDKPVPYYKYIFKYEKQLPNNTKLIINFIIPNLAISLRKLRNIDDETIKTNIETYNTYLDIITELTLHTNSIIISTNNNDEIIKTPNDIWEYYRNIPIMLFDDIYDYFTQNILIYKPKYAYSTICPSCNKTVKLVIHPLMEFLSLTDNINSTKILDEQVELFEALYIVTNKRYTQIEEFLNMPYPLYIKLSKKLIEIFNKEIKQLKQAIKKGSVPLNILNNF